MKRFLKKRYLIIVAVITAVVLTVFLNSRNKGTAEVFVNVAELEKKTMEQIISVKAPLEGIEKADVVSPLNYEIIEINVREGDLVKKDQILAVLDSVELKKQVADEENQIVLAELEQQDRIKAMQIEYDKALNAVKNLEESYEQNKKLLEGEIITQEAFDKVEESLKEARRNLESFNTSNGRVVLSPADLKRIEVMKEKLENKNDELDKIFIKSPIDGTVTRVNVNIGRYAKDNDGKPMFVVENLNKLQMKVSISEYDIAKLKLDQDVDVYSDVMGSAAAKGKVARISPTAEQKDNNTMERVIPVVIDITEQPDSLIAGVIATAKIKVDRADDVFAVPSGAIVVDENNEAKIYVLKDDNAVKSIAVETGLETDLETQITSSELTEKMKIVINPDLNLKDNMVVKPNKAEE